MGAGVFNTDPRAWLRWLVRAGVAVGVVLLLSALPYRLIGGTGAGKLGAMRQELSRVELEIGQTSSELKQRRRRVDALKNDTRTIETIARQELHMLYPHEKTLRLSDADKRAGTTAEAQQ